MKQHDKIFDLFRDNQHKLNERPSLQAWNKLERRLEQKQRVKRKGNTSKFSIYSIVMMAAAAAALIFFLTTMSNIVEVSRNQKPVVIKEYTPTESVQTYELVAEQNFREQYQEVLNRTFEEGNTGRMIVAKQTIRPFLVPKRS